MNREKLIPTAVVFLIAAACWFVPPPEGLCRTSAMGKIAATASSIAYEAKAIRVGQVANALPRLASESAATIAEDDASLSVEQVQAIAEASGPWVREDGTIVSDRDEAVAAGRRSWRLFVIFASTIVLILMNTMPIFTASLVALSLAILTGTLTPAAGYSGFSKDFIILIVVAFTVAIGVAKSGLGSRLAWIIISKFGSSSLGLGYSLVLTDVLIAPAFPSNTARSGVLFPVVDSVARGRESPPEEGKRRKLGAFLAMNSILGLSLSSALWLTAMAANPAGAEIAGNIAGLEITFATWVQASCVPTLAALAIVPVLLYRFFPPELRKTPEAPETARAALKEMGPLSRNEKVMSGVFLVLVVLWGLSKLLSINIAAVAIAGLAVLLLTKVVTLNDVRGSNGPITFVWFASLFTLSTYLDKYGFMQWVGEAVAGVVNGLPWPAVYVLLVVAYVLIHYVFVSQTAHMFAVMPIFLTVGIASGVPGGLLAMMLLLATNFFSPITPQASSANAIFVGSGYLSMGEIYRYGGLVTLLNLIVYMTVGTAWLMFVTGA